MQLRNLNFPVHYLLANLNFRVQIAKVNRQVQIVENLMNRIASGLFVLALTVRAAAAGGFGIDLPRFSFPSQEAPVTQTTGAGQSGR